MSQLAFGSESGLGAGDACGRCFQVTANKDPYSTGYTGPFNTIVVKTTNLCPYSGNEEWCGQTTADPVNSFGAAVQCVIPPPPCVSWLLNKIFLVALTCARTRVPLLRSSHRDMAR
jgi:hypothetical protein